MEPREEVRRLLVEAYGEELDVNGMDTPLKDLGVDSLELMNMANKLEERFSIEIPNRDMSKIMKGTGNQLADYVQFQVGGTK